MIKVAWPTYNMDKKPQIWRLLDLSGLTNNVRQSKNYLKSGFVFVDGNPVRSLRDTVSMGAPFTLSLRFPNGRTFEHDMMVVTSVPGKQRSSDPFTKNYRG